MDEQSKEKFELVVHVVQITLSGISQLFQEFGIQGMIELTNPSIDSLKSVIADMKKDADDVRRSLQGNNSINACYAEMRLQNIDQGLFYAENLLRGVENRDVMLCNEAHRDMQRNTIICPSWAEDEKEVI